MPEKDTNARDMHIYIDDATGDMYIFNGTQLIKIGNSTPQIGDKGDDEFQSKEEEERKAQIQKEREEAEANGEEYEDEETEEQHQQRLDDIKGMLGDEVTKNDIENEASTQIDKELKKKKAASEKQRRKYSSSTQRFQNSLRNFVAKQVQRERYKSWQKENPSFEGSGIMMPARMTTETKKVPKINVYFDQSGSWGDSDIRKGQEAIGILNNYVKRGEIVINIYYFANHIHDNPEDTESGTHAGAELIEHIRATKPDNVIVMTDNDFDWAGEINDAPFIKVPGAVWFLFRSGERSQLLQQHLQGKSQTLAFDI